MSVPSTALFDILSGADDSVPMIDMLRLAAEYLDDSGFRGPLVWKLRAKATRIEYVLSNAHALAEDRSDDSQQRVVGGKVDR